MRRDSFAKCTSVERQCSEDGDNTAQRARRKIPDTNNQTFKINSATRIRD